jgi:hypothetical protein
VTDEESGFTCMIDRSYLPTVQACLYLFRLVFRLGFLQCFFRAHTHDSPFCMLFVFIRKVEFWYSITASSITTESL